MSASGDDREAAGNRDRIADRADRHLADQSGQLVGQLLGADPAELAAERGGRRLGELARISGEGGAGADLLDDPRRIGLHLGRRFRRRAR